MEELFRLLGMRCITEAVGVGGVHRHRLLLDLVVLVVVEQARKER